MKVLAIICGILLLACVCLWNWALHERTQRIETAASLKTCIEEREAYNEKDVEASRTIAKLRRLVAKNQPVDCDCYNLPVPDDVADFVREQRKNWAKK